MMARAGKVFLVLLLILSIASFAAKTADSAQDMLAAGRVDDAMAALQARLASTPSDAEANNLLCRAYYELEDWNHAEPFCKNAIALDPAVARYHLWLGRVYGEKADRAGFIAAASLASKVREEFERAVQLDPNDLDARSDLTEFYIQAPALMGGGEHKAIQQAQFIAKLNAAREHWVYARIAEKRKDTTTAEREYRQAIDLSHGDAEARLDLAIFLRRQKRLDEMEQAIIKLSQSPTPKSDVLVDASQNLYRAGRNFPLAADLMRRYLAAGPVEASPAFRVHYQLGLVLEKQGDKDGAAREFHLSLSMARNFDSAQQALNRVTH